LEANRLTGLRKRVAREAAFLLYTSQENEYKQAKKRATKTLGVRILPSNLEVAEELDKIAEEKEGPSRRERLFQMRKEALQIMEPLKDFNPRLVGSVWRGTAHQNSDIDILAFSQDPELVLGKLQKNEYRITGSEWRSVTKRGKKEASFHIHFVLPSGYEAEVVVRYPEKMSRAERCEIYGDTVTGLSHPQLQKVLREKPLQKFVPT
jgi:predicted nucleotidyltransferase